MTSDQLEFHLPAPPATGETPLIPARMVNEYVYCPRIPGRALAKRVFSDPGNAPHVVPTPVALSRGRPDRLRGRSKKPLGPQSADGRGRSDAIAGPDLASAYPDTACGLVLGGGPSGGHRIGRPWTRAHDGPRVARAPGHPRAIATLPIFLRSAPLRRAGWCDQLAGPDLLRLVAATINYIA